MNIFVLHENPIRAAQMMCDRHIVKMISESAQLLCFSHHVTTEAEWVAKNVYFKFNKTHARHPCTLWVMEDPRHYAWLYRHLIALIKEYDHRYQGLQHGKYAGIIGMLPALDRVCGTQLSALSITDMPDEFALAMGKAPECIGEYAVESYRRFYIVDKHSFATWKNRPIPLWFDRGRQLYLRHVDINRIDVMV